MAFIPRPDFWGPDFGIDQIDWSADNPADVNTGRYSGKRDVVTDPWHTKLYATVKLCPVAGAASVRALRSFLRRAKGVTNTFSVPATTTAQNEDEDVLLAAAAAAGATTIQISGYTELLLDGDFFTLNDQLCICTEDQDGGILAFDPPLREAASIGATVVTNWPYAVVAMMSSRQGWTEAGVVHGASFDVEEALLEHADGSAATIDSTTLTWDSATSTWDAA